MSMAFLNFVAHEMDCLYQEGTSEHLSPKHRSSWREPTQRSMRNQRSCPSHPAHAGYPPSPLYEGARSACCRTFALWSPTEAVIGRWATATRCSTFEVRRRTIDRFATSEECPLRFANLTCAFRVQDIEYCYCNR